MSTLHTVNKSPFTHKSLSACLEVCGIRDGILLIEDGVLGALGSSPCHNEMSELIAQGIKIFALSSDVRARGLSEKVRPDITLTDYDGFVKLSMQHKCVQSWY